jgi:hypothetical protein
MFTHNIPANAFAAFAAIFSAMLFVSASIAPAVNSAATIL